MAGWDDEDFALSVGEYVGVYVEVFWGLLPVVDVDPVDQEAAFGDVEVFCFEFMTLPGTDSGCVRVADGVEAFDAIEGEVVDEADGAAVVGVEVSFDYMHLVLADLRKKWNPQIFAYKVLADFR